MAVLVTGAAGFLGKRLVDRLVALGHNVIAIARDPIPEKLKSFNNIAWIEKDIAIDGFDPVDLSDVDTIFHLAGAKELGANDDERVFLTANEEVTLRLLHASSKFVKKFIFASSQMVYGDPGHTSVSEDFPLFGMDSSAYACSKLNAENWLRCLRKQHGGLYLALRFCGIVEGGGNIDYLIDRALRDEPIELFSKGLVCRDYLPAEKAVEAFIAASLYEADPGFEAFNIGSGQAITTYGLAKLVCEELDSKSEIILSDRLAPRNNFVFNISKAIRHFGFEPGDLSESVRAYARKKLASFN